MTLGLVRRRFEIRKLFHGLVEVLSDFWDEPVHLGCTDLSPRGTYLVTDYPLEVGEPLVMSFALPGVRNRLLASGTVRYVSLGRRRVDQGEGGMAVEFDEMSPLERIAVRSALRPLPPRLPGARVPA